MNLGDRVVTQIPMERLWTDSAEVTAVRGRSLDRAAIRDLLRQGPVQFVVADVGTKLRWIPLGKRFEFWKSDASARIAESEKIYLEDFPAGHAYVASEWCLPDEEPRLVLLEVVH